MNLLASHQSSYHELEENLQNILKPKAIERILGLEETARQLCAALILRYFSESGLMGSKGLCMKFSELQSLLSVGPQYEKMLKFFIAVLETQGIVKNGKDGIHFLKGEADVAAVPLLLRKIKDVYPKFIQFFNFVEQSAKNYPEVFSGSKPGLKVIFPDGDSGVLERIYKNTPQIGYEYLYLNLLRDIIAHHCDRLDAAFKKPALLEIGGGQGILTDTLLPGIGHRLGAYYFTDIGQAFVNQAKKKYTDEEGSLMHFAVLDASQEPLQQGFSLETFDFLVGFNVLHATVDISKTLGEAAKLVKKGGMMLFVENVKQQPWIDMIYGLTEGWWHFDDGIREISPLLTVSQWERVLGESGFQHSAILPQSADLRKQTDSALVIVHKD